MQCANNSSTAPPPPPSAGVKQELLPLMKVPGMNAARARALYRAGFKDPQALAVGEQAAVERALAAGLAHQMRGRMGGSGSGPAAGGKPQQQQQVGGWGARRGG